jgi:hypothetical protein
LRFGPKSLGLGKAAQEMARKQRNAEKMQRRQGKTLTSPSEELPAVAEGTSYRSGKTDPAGSSLRLHIPIKIQMEKI